MTESAALREAADFLSAKGIGVPSVCLVLGSGFKGVASSMGDATEFALGDVPNWPSPRVEGHGGSLLVGDVGGTAVACLTGRVHLYEGWTPAEVVRAVRTLRMLGVPRFLLTNAAGGVRSDLRAGDLVLIADHLNLTGMSPLLGPAEDDLGPRVPDLSNVYSQALRELLLSIDDGLRTGVYAGNLGPSYETPAEVRMAAAMGADMVGMSTVHEAIALHAMGAEVAGLSLVSNLAAGISDTPLSHDEVIAAGRAAEGRINSLLAEFCRRL